MATLQVDWRRINELRGQDLKRATFKALQDASHLLQAASLDEPSLLEAVPRLSELIDRNPDDLGSFKEIVSSLARSTGLWNYIDKNDADAADLIVAEAVTSEELGGIVLHREQVNALKSLLDGKNLILSAPTSFGKSILVDALLATDRYKRIAVVLPTIALLDEFRRRFQKKFADKFTVIMHQGEVATDEPTIFLGTQERLIYRRDLGQLDLTVVDEFYKLDPSRQDDRSVTLNAAVYKLLKRSNQFFFLGPNIDHVAISSDNRWNFEFLRTRFSTVAVDTLDLQNITDKRERLIEEIGDEANWPALVFVSSPDKANKLAIELSKKMAVSDETGQFAGWLKANIGAGNFLSEAVRYGFGVHHGRIPRSIASRMVRLFDQQKLPVLLCTSTLIEGVNTAAKTVMIFDKEINRDSYDFFTFCNIRGRAGRLGKHHVGQVIVFNESPAQSELEISPTMFGEDENFPDEYIVHIDEPDRSPRSTGRMDYFQEQLGLKGDELRLASSIGLDTAVALKQEVLRSLKNNDNLLWTGWPKWPEIEELCQIVCKHKSVNSFGAYSDRQLTMLISKLRQSRTLKEFLLQQDKNYRGRPEGRDNIFKFLRACEYGLPQHFSVIEMFVRQVHPYVDFSVFVGGLNNWFRPEILKELDEEGVPVQIAERFYNDGDTKSQLKTRLASASGMMDPRLTEFERDWLDDVL